jgi:hypothetical protein
LTSSQLILLASKVAACREAAQTAEIIRAIPKARDEFAHLEHKSPEEIARLEG